MKILVLPDIHGRNFWKNCNFKEADHIVFLGDYFDPYSDEGITPKDSINNFKELIKYLEDNDCLDKSEFLIGNHDVHYLFDYVSISSRYDEKNKNIYKELLVDLLNKDLLYFNTWITQNNVTYLFTHAGINKNWFDRHSELCDIKSAGLIKHIPINELSEDEILALDEIGLIRGGWSITGGPLWDDVREFIKYPKFSSYYQVFGHTQLNHEIFISDIRKENPNINCEDFACLDCRHAFIIENNTFTKI